MAGVELLAGRPEELRLVAREGGEAHVPEPVGEHAQRREHEDDAKDPRHAARARPSTMRRLSQIRPSAHFPWPP